MPIPIDRDKMIIITGAFGFIGSALVKYFNDQGIHQLVLVDDSHSTDKWKNLKGKNFYEIVSRTDLFDYLEDRQNDIQAIIHMGACSNTKEKDVDYLMENNYRFTIGLAEYALHHQIRFIYASSAATYGSGSSGYRDDHALLPSLQPLNAYAFSKHAFDLWAYNQKVIDQITGLKFFNVFGPNEGHKMEMASMVYHFYHQIARDKKVRLFKSTDLKNYAHGNQVRDFIYVKDVVALIGQLLVHPMMGIYNCGSGQAHTWNQLAQAVFQACGIKESIEYIDMPLELVASYQNYTLADLTKLQEQFQIHHLDPFQPTPLKTAVVDYVQNYLMKNTLW